MLATERVRQAVEEHPLYRHARTSSVMGVFLRGAITALSIGVLTRFISFPLNIILARAMGSAEFGVYSYVSNWAFLAGLVALVGFGSSVKRYVAAYAATDQLELLAGVLRRSREIALVASVAMGMGVLLAVLAFHDQMSRSLAFTFAVAGVGLPLTTLQALQVANLVALKRFAPSQVLQGLAPPILLGVAAGALWLIRGETIRSYEAYVMFVLAAGVLLLAGQYFIRGALPRSPRTAQREYRTREWLRVSLPMLLVDGIRELMNRSDIILIGLLLGTTEAGIYVIALNLARFTSFGLRAATTASLPLIAELHALGRRDELQRVFAAACWTATLSSAAIAAALVLLGGPLLGLFGPEFQAGATVMGILIVGRVADAMSGPNGSLLNMTGHQDGYAVILGVTAVANVALSYPAILAWGIEGAAVVTGASLVMKNVAVWVVVRRAMGLNASIFGPLPMRRAAA